MYRQTARTTVEKELKEFIRTSHRKPKRFQNAREKDDTTDARDGQPSSKDCDSSSESALASKPDKKRRVSKTIFDQARKEVFELMERDSYTWWRAALRAESRRRRAELAGKAPSRTSRCMAPSRTSRCKAPSRYMAPSRTSRW